MILRLFETFRWYVGFIEQNSVAVCSDTIVLYWFEMISIITSNVFLSTRANLTRRAGFHSGRCACFPSRFAVFTLQGFTRRPRLVAVYTAVTIVPWTTADRGNVRVCVFESISLCKYFKYYSEVRENISPVPFLLLAFKRLILLY